MQLLVSLKQPGIIPLRPPELPVRIIFILAISDFVNFSLPLVSRGDINRFVRHRTRGRRLVQCIQAVLFTIL